MPFFVILLTATLVPSQASAMAWPHCETGLPSHLAGGCDTQDGAYALRCFSVEVVTPVGSPNTLRGDPDESCYDQWRRFEVVVDEESASGRIVFGGAGDPGDTSDLPRGPGLQRPTGAASQDPGLGSPLFPPAPDLSVRETPDPSEADVDFEVYFELRYDPCADPVFRTDDAVHASGPTAAQAGRSQSVSAAEACRAAGALLPEPTTDAALALLRALLAVLDPSFDTSQAPRTSALDPRFGAPSAPDLPTYEAPSPSVPSAPSGATGSGHGHGSTGADGPRAEAEASADAGVLGPVEVALGTTGAAPRDAVVPVAGPSRPDPAPAPGEVDAPVRSTPSATPRPPAGAAPFGDDAGLRGEAATLAPAVAAARPVVPGRPTVPTEVLVGLAAGAALAPLLVALYSRISRGQVLDHPLRRRVYDAASARRAATAREVADDLGIGANTVRHHLETLSKNGFLGRAPSSRGPVFHVAEARAEALRAEPEPLSQRVLALVARSPGLNTSEVARALGVSKCVAQNHVLDLLTSGKIVHRREGGARLLYPA